MHDILKNRLKVSAVACLGMVMSSMSAFAQSAPAELILTNGKVVTLDAGSKIAQAVAVSGGKVLAVGSPYDIEKYKGPSTKVIDLHGHTMIPGLNDSHVHISGIGASTFNDARIGDVHSISELLKVIGDAAKRKRPGEWISVSGDLRLTRIKEGRYPTLQELDSVTPNNPVLVPTGHLSTANSLALKLAGITKDTPNPQGGLIGHDGKTGELNGVLEERASGLVGRLQQRPQMDMKTAIINAHEKLVSLGFTSVREPGVSYDVWQAYKQLDAEHRLLIRSAVLLRPAGSDAVKQVESWGSEKGAGDDMLHLWGIKLGIDGGLVLTNAGYMKEPYLDKPGYRGVQTMDVGDFYKLVSTANKVGLRVGVHATGDAGIEIVLDTYKKVNAEKNITTQRWSVEHADLPTPHSMQLLKDLHVVASIQPSMLSTAPAILLMQLGPQRVNGFLPYQTFKNEGVVMAGGSDSSAFDVNPYHGIWAAVTRKVISADNVVAPEQRLSREDAIKVYVQGGAYLTFEERVKGSIEPGKFADFAVLSDDILTCEEDRIREITPVLTIMGGKITYHAASP